MINSNIILQSPLTISLIVLIFGVFFYLFPPKKINDFYGCRSTKARRSQKAWDFAQKKSSISFIMVGLLASIFSVFFYVLFDSKLATILSLLVLTLLFLIGLLYTNKKLSSFIKKNQIITLLIIFSLIELNVYTQINDIVFFQSDTFNLEGTLLTPNNNKEKHTVIIFVHGSGPNDRQSFEKL